MKKSLRKQKRDWLNYFLAQVKYM